MPLSGTITNIKSKVGDKVRSGQVVLVLEAMKMETEVVAEENFEILQIPVAVGDKVAQGQALIKFRKRKLIMDLIQELWLGSGLAKLTLLAFVMLSVSCLLIYLAIAKSFEPLILLPLGFGGLLANIPGSQIAKEGGLLFLFKKSV